MTFGIGIKIEFTNWSFELHFIYETALTPSPFSVSRSDGVRRRRRPRAAPSPRPWTNHLVRPWFRSKPLPLAPLERDTRPAVPCPLRRTRMAVAVPPCRAISPPLKLSPVHSRAKSKLASPLSLLRARARAPLSVAQSAAGAIAASSPPDPLLWPPCARTKQPTSSHTLHRSSPAHPSSPRPARTPPAAAMGAAAPTSLWSL